MSKEAADLWDRANKAINVAGLDISLDADSAASRAYYAAFYAVSALFALEGKTFRKHSAVESAVHRDLINTGRWDGSLGDDFASLREARTTADYGGSIRLSSEEAAEAIKAARRILEAVQKEYPSSFPLG